MAVLEVANVPAIGEANLSWLICPCAAYAQLISSSGPSKERGHLIASSCLKRQRGEQLQTGMQKTMQAMTAMMQLRQSEEKRFLLNGDSHRRLRWVSI